MKCRKLEITLVSAKSLPDTRTFGRMKVYAKVSILGDTKSTTKKTPADEEGETNPRWNFTVDYVVSESAIQNPDIKVSIKLFCKKSILRDDFIGEVNIPVKNLFVMGLKSDKAISCGVCGTSKGRLNILYSFGETVSVRKSSGFRWKNAVEAGLLVLLGGAISLLGDDNEEEEDDAVRSEVSGISKDARFVEDEEDVVFYDC